MKTNRSPRLSCVTFLALPLAAIAIGARSAPAWQDSVATQPAVQAAPPTHAAQIHLRLIWDHASNHRAVPAVLWLEPLAGTPPVPWLPGPRYTLVQKNRIFLPHLLVVPVDAVVQFPNQDPFFHNVFSLFDGKRFDLGLYEAGSSKSVHFSREGVSYIFCNIHPEMSAVVVSLSTSLHAVADRGNAFTLAGIPPGDYRLRLWIEGVPLPALDSMSRPLHIAAGAESALDLGSVTVPASASTTPPHTNKFGQPYDPTPKAAY